MNEIIELREPDGSLTAVEARPLHDRITRTARLMHNQREGAGATGTPQNETMILWAENRSPAQLELFVHSVARESVLAMAHTAPVGAVMTIANNLNGFAMNYRGIRPDILQTVTTLVDVEPAQLRGEEGRPLDAETAMFHDAIRTTVDLMATSSSASGKKLGHTASMLSIMHRKFAGTATRRFVDEVLTATVDQMLRETVPPLFPFITQNMAGFALAWRTIRPLTEDNTEQGDNS